MTPIETIGNLNMVDQVVNVAEFDPGDYLARLEKRFAPMKRG